MTQSYLLKFLYLLHIWTTCGFISQWISKSWQLSKYLCFCPFFNYKEFVALPIKVFYKLSILVCQIFNHKTTEELELFSK